MTSLSHYDVRLPFTANDNDIGLENEGISNANANGCNDACDCRSDLAMQSHYCS